MNIFQLVIYIAEFHQREVSEPIVRMYAQDLSVLSVEEIQEAWSVYKANPSNTRMPLPSQLIALARPEYDTENTPKRLVEQLFVLVKLQGRNWSASKDHFIEKAGELAYSVVQAYGGWVPFCQSFDKCNSLENHKAQIRNFIKSHMESLISGKNDKKICLPTPLGSSNKKSVSKLDSFLGGNNVPNIRKGQAPTKNK